MPDLLHAPQAAYPAAATADNQISVEEETDSDLEIKDDSESLKRCDRQRSITTV